MDDMKRAIYLELLRTLERTGCRAYICVHLQCQLEDVFGVRKDKSQTNFADLIAEFFPEFTDLYDGYKYNIDDRYQCDRTDPWFAIEARHARLSLINFLLTHR